MKFEKQVENEPQRLLNFVSDLAHILPTGHSAATIPLLRLHRKPWPRCMPATVLGQLSVQY